MGPLYCTREHVYEAGLPRGTAGNLARLVASSLASTDTLELDGHGFATNAPVSVRALEGGVLSAPLVEGVTYYVIRINEATFKLSATSGGSAINLTTDGSSMLVGYELPFDSVIEFYSRWADSSMPAHVVPLEQDNDGNYAPLVRGIVARLCARELQRLAGETSISMGQVELEAKAQLERWGKGIPIRDVSITKIANLAVSGDSASADPRGWGSGSLP